jgi:hypothetical protein
MRGLFKLSNVPFKSKESTRASSLASSTTDSSSSTAPGLGTLSGRLVIGLGDTVLRGVDHLVIRRALEMVKSIFPHDDDTAPDNIGTLYDDVLELSR